MEREWIEQAGRGDEASFSLLVKKYSGQIYDQIYEKAGTRDDALSWTVETFLRAWRAVGLFQFDVPFGGWLGSIAEDVCSSHRRRHQKQGQDTETSPTDEEILRAVMQAIHSEQTRLSPKKLLTRFRFTLIAIVIAALLLLGSRLGLPGGGAPASSPTPASAAPAAPQVSAAFQAG